MGWLTKALSPEDPAAPLLPGSWLGEALGVGQGNDAGVVVNERNSRAVSGVLACTRVISEAAAAYPIEIYQKLPIGKRWAPEHPLYSMLHDSPNTQMSNFTFRTAVTAQTCLWGNGYAEIQRDGANRARGLWPLPSDRTGPRRLNGVLEYLTTATADGHERVIQAANILHLPFLSFDGLQGYSPIQIRRQGLGLNLAAERFGAMLFGKGSRPSGLLTTPNVLKKESRDNMKASWREATSGANAMSVPVMEEGVTFVPMMINPTDAQFLETRKYQLEEVARDYRVPAHMLGILERATHSNSEQLALDFSTYTMMFWVLIWEQELNRKLFAGTKFYAKLNMDYFLRGDFATRTTGYQILRNCGVLSANNICDMEEWERIPEDEGGDVRIVPLNMVSLETVKKMEGEPAPDPQDPTEGISDGDEEDETGSQQRDLRERYALAFVRLFHDATGRTINREKRDAAFVAKVWLPTLTALADSMAAINGQNALKEETHTFLAGYVGAIATRCTDWVKAAADQTAVMEFNRAYGALQKQLEA